MHTHTLRTLALLAVIAPALLSSGCGETRVEYVLLSSVELSRIDAAIRARLVEVGRATEDDKIERLQGKVADENGFTLVRHKLELYGVCPECQAKAKKRARA